MEAVIFHGEIGAGKSTLLKQVASRLKHEHGIRVSKAYEPVDEWQKVNALKMLYAGLASEDEDKRSMAIVLFQAIASSSRVERIDFAITEVLDIDARTKDDTVYVFIERSPTTDKYVFVRALAKSLSPDYLDMYEFLWEKIEKDHREQMSHFKKVHHVYLKPAIETCMTRIKSRNRESEGGVSLDYQRELRKHYEGYVCNIRNPLIIEGAMAEGDFREGDAKKVIVDRVLKHIMGAAP